MGQLQEALSEATAPTVKQCIVAKTMAEMDDEDRQTFVNMLATRNLSATIIINVLSKIGISMGRTAINDHRTGRCPCDA